MGEAAVGCGRVAAGCERASTLGIAGLRADQGRDAHNASKASDASDASKARHASKARRASDPSTARDARDAVGVRR